MMYVFIFVIFVILLILILLSMVPLNIKCSFNSEKLADFKLSLLWLRPLIKGMVKRDGNNVIFTLYLYNKKILSKNLTAKKSKRTNNFKLIKYIKFLDVRLQTSYGFEDPSITGMVCGAINIISEYIDSNDSVNNPDFSTDYDYFNFNVAVKVNVLVSFLNILKSKKSGLAMQELHVSK
jgi:hypothetical protein